MRRGRDGDHRENGDDGQEPHVLAVGGVAAIPRPGQELGPDRHPEPDEADHPTAVEVGPQHHHEWKELERPAASREVSLQPVELEAGQKERDHLGAGPPDRRACDGPDRQPDSGDHPRLAADLPVHEPETGPGQQAEGQAQPDHSGRPVDEPHQDLSQVLVVGPDVSGNGEGVEIDRGEAAVVEHPLPGPQVPPEVGVLLAGDEKREGHDHHSAQEQRPRAQPLGQPPTPHQRFALKGLGR